MNSLDPANLLARAVRRAAVGPAPLIAGLIEVWRKAFPEQPLDQALIASNEKIAELALCRRPRDEHWIEDVVEIAKTLILDTDHLISFLRAAEAVERFSIAHPSETSEQGRLLAARDRDEVE